MISYTQMVVSLLDHQDFHHRVPIVGTQSLPQEQDHHELMLNILFLGVFAGIER